MLKTIKDAVEEVTGLRINKIHEQREYVMARCLFYHFARELTGRPFAEIGAVTNTTTLRYYTLSKNLMYITNLMYFLKRAFTLWRVY